MIRSFIRQLSTSPFPEAIYRLSEKHKKCSSEPGIEELTKTLGDLIDVLGEVFIVIDALDECPQTVGSREREKLLGLIHSLFRNHGNNLHILATSRPELDIHSKLKSYPAIDVETAVDSDIRCFVKHSISFGNLKGWDNNIKQEIEDSLLGIEER